MGYVINPSAVAILVDARAKSGVSQRVLAGKIGIHKSMISRIEAGLRSFPVELVDEWAAAVGADSDAVYFVLKLVPPDIVKRLISSPELIAEVRELIS